MHILNASFPSVNKVKKTLRIAAAAVMLSIPLKTGTDMFVKSINREIPKLEIATKESVSILRKNLTENFKTEQIVNCRGGVTNTYTIECLEKLRETLMNSRQKTSYTLPIDSQIKAYIPSTGQFGSIRPQGRAHLGVDIYPRLYGRKPKKPVAVLSATDGIVVSVKESPKHDPKNLIANNIKIMAPDGKIYSYDHLGRPEDYKGAKYIPLKKLGETVNAGDTLGTVGKTGETDVWHLHFGVEDMDVQKEQFKNPIWQKLFKNHSVYATPRGQVDPLDSTKAGGISQILNKYQVDKGPKVDYVDKL